MDIDGSLCSAFFLLFYSAGPLCFDMCVYLYTMYLIAVSKGIRILCGCRSWLFWAKNIMCVHVSKWLDAWKHFSVCAHWVVKIESSESENEKMSRRRSESELNGCLCVYSYTILHHTMPSPLQKTKFSMFCVFVSPFFFCVAILMPCIWCISYEQTEPVKLIGVE